MVQRDPTGGTDEKRGDELFAEHRNTPDRRRVRSRSHPRHAGRRPVAVIGDGLAAGTVRRVNLR